MPSMYDNTRNALSILILRYSHGCYGDREQFDADALSTDLVALAQFLDGEAPIPDHLSKLDP